MNEIERRALAFLVQRIEMEIAERGGDQALYTIARSWVGDAWVRGIGGGQGAADVPRPAPIDAPALASLWQLIADPLGRGVRDELEARITTLVRPTVEKAAILGAAGGALLGWQGRKWLG